ATAMRAAAHAIAMVPASAASLRGQIYVTPVAVLVPFRPTPTSPAGAGTPLLPGTAPRPIARAPSPAIAALPRPPRASRRRHGLAATPRRPPHDISSALIAIHIIYRYCNGLPS